MKKTLQFLAVILLRGLMVLMSWLPLRLCHGLGRTAGFLLARFPNRVRRTTEINLGLCFPTAHEREQRQLTRDSLCELGKALFEMGILWRHPPPRLLARIRGSSGEAEFEAAFQTGKGIIVAGPHLGAWEIMGLYLGQRHGVASLYRPPRLRALDSYIRRCRERSGAVLVPVDGAGVRLLNRTLKQGGMVGILPDQLPKGGSGVRAPFFGVPTATMTLISRLAARTGARVFLAWAERLPRGQGYHLHFTPIEGLHDPDPTAASAALNRGIERGIRQCPQQYLWSYNRFHRNPDGSPREPRETEKPTPADTSG